MNLCSSAEVRAAAAESQDPELNRLFRTGIDVYINTAKLYYKNWDQMSKADQKAKRKQFKTIFLGLLYGLGIKSLAQRLNCSEDEAKNIIEATYQAYPKLREYIASQQKWPLDHGGYVKTIFGDKLKVQEYDWMLKATSTGEYRNLQARIQRLGVNLPKIIFEWGEYKYV